MVCSAASLTFHMSVQKWFAGFRGPCNDRMGVALDPPITRKSIVKTRLSPMQLNLLPVPYSIEYGFVGLCVFC